VPGLDRARNVALAAARTELVAFLDDDAVADRCWARSIRQAFAEEPELAVLTGLVLPHELQTRAQHSFERYAGFGKGFDRRWWEDRVGDQITTDPAVRFRTWEIGTGANMAIRRDKLLAVGGFNTALDAGTPALGCGDLEMFFRVVKRGLSLRYEPGALVWHKHRREMRELQAQVRGFGSCAAMVIAIVRADRREMVALPKLLSWYRSYFGWRIRTGSATDRWLFMHELAGYLRVLTVGAWLAMRGARRVGDLTPAGQERSVPRTGRAGHAGIAIELREPQPRYYEVPGPSNVRVTVSVAGRALGELTVPSGTHGVSFAKIRAAMAREFGLALVAPGDRETVAAQLAAAAVRPLD
jgi:GT2 family glycosyltransferase